MADTPHLDALPTLTDRAGHACPKPVRILDTRITQNRLADLAWHNCIRLVDERDGWRCRVCHGRVVKTLTVCPERAEHHHLVQRSRAPGLRADPRNVVLVCAIDHGRLTRHELEPFGLAADRFVVHARAYLNADAPLIFRPP